MKTNGKINSGIIAVFIFIYSTAIMAQNHRETIAILGIDVHGISNINAVEANARDKFIPAQMANLVRLEIEKLDSFEVTDSYDANYILRPKKMNPDSSFGKISALEYGSVLDVDKAITGNVDRYADYIVFTFRLIDIQTKKVLKTQVREFLNLPNEIQLMVRITLNDLFEIPNNAEIVERLTKKYNYENIINNPQCNRLNLSGPRMGLVGFSGNQANIMMQHEGQGGFDAWPVMFQFGYQFEMQYLNEGKYQALFEIIPMISGMDQSLLLPSLTVLNGLRNNVNGWEFAMGPSFNVVTIAKGYYNNGNWIMDKELGNTERLDSRGDYRLKTSFVIAVGKSFKSGKLNIPFNAFMIPSKDGVRFGVSFGFNAKK